MPLDLQHETVTGAEIALVSVSRAGGGAMVEPWVALSTEPRLPVNYTLSFRVNAGSSALEIPPCAGRGVVTVDAATANPPKGPWVVDLDSRVQHEVAIRLRVSSYEKAIRCAYAPRAGTRTTRATGLVRVAFASPSARAGGGHAVLFIPTRVDPNVSAPLLVGLHPWNSDEWTYANYTELLNEAELRGVVLLMPNGLGNSLYVAAAENEVMRALDETVRTLAIDPARVSIWGASMGGQGATTVGFHRPDRFASVTSFFGDARFDVASYVKNILPTEEAAHEVNPLDVADNARHQDVLLVHGEDDRTSPIKESIDLDAGLRKLGYHVTFVRHPHMGHEAPMIMLHVRDIVRRAETAKIPANPARVTYRSVRASDVSAYGVTIERAHAGDAFVDLERTSDAVIHVHAADNVKRIQLAPNALSTPTSTPTPTSSSTPTPTPNPPIVYDAGARARPPVIVSGAP